MADTKAGTFSLVSRTIHVTLPVECDDNELNKDIAEEVDRLIDNAMEYLRVGLAMIPPERIGNTSASLLQLEVHA